MRQKSSEKSSRNKLTMILSMRIMFRFLIKSRRNQHWGWLWCSFNPDQCQSNVNCDNYDNEDYFENLTLRMILLFLIQIRIEAILMSVQCQDNCNNDEYSKIFDWHWGWLWCSQSRSGPRQFCSQSNVNCDNEDYSKIFDCHWVWWHHDVDVLDQDQDPILMSVQCQDNCDYENYFENLTLSMMLMFLIQIRIQFWCQSNVRPGWNPFPADKQTYHFTFQWRIFIFLLWWYPTQSRLAN